MTWSTVYRWTRSSCGSDLREPVRPGASGGRCFVEVKRCAPAARVGGVAPDRRREVQLVLQPRPLRLLALCAMVRGLGKAMATPIRSCRKNERRRRSLRRQALPVPPPASPRSAMAGQPLRFEQQGIPKATQTCLNLVWCVVVVVVVRTRCNRVVFIHTTARMHRITVAEHLGVKLPVSPPTWASKSRMDGGRKMLHSCSENIHTSAECGNGLEAISQKYRHFCTAQATKTEQVTARYRSEK